MSSNSGHDAAVEFFSVTAEPANPEDVEIGQAIYLEVNREAMSERSIVIVRDKWTTEDGRTQLRITDPERGEKYETPTLSIIAQHREDIE